MRVHIAAGHSDFGVVFLSADTDAGYRFRVPARESNKNTLKILIPHSGVEREIQIQLTGHHPINRYEAIQRGKNRGRKGVDCGECDKTMRDEEQEERPFVLVLPTRQKLSDVSDKMLTEGKKREREGWSETGWWITCSDVFWTWKEKERVKRRTILIKSIHHFGGRGEERSTCYIHQKLLNILWNSLVRLFFFFCPDLPSRVFLYMGFWIIYFLPSLSKYR